MTRWEGPGGRDSCLPSPRQVPRAPGGGAGGEGAGESRGCGVAGFCSAVYQKAGGGAREPPHCSLAPSQLACWVTRRARPS